MIQDLCAIIQALKEVALIMSFIRYHIRSYQLIFLVLAGCRGCSSKSPKAISRSTRQALSDRISSVRSRT